MKNLLCIVWFLWFMLLLIIMGGCGSKNTLSGTTEHKVSGTATVRFEIDVGLCDSVPEERRADCVLALVELLNKQKEGMTK